MRDKLVRPLPIVALLFTTLCAVHAQSLLNVRFATDANKPKVGPAAIGQSATDFWNLYSRDIPGSSGTSWRASGQVTNMVSADGTASSAVLAVDNAMGAWFTSSPDPMFYSYLYPLSRQGNITVILTQLPPGSYDIYIYAHGAPDQENGVISVSSGGVSLGPKSTTSAPGWNTTNWQNGVQFVLFTNVAVLANQPLVITSQPGSSGLAVINGLQILQQGGSPVVEPPASATPVVVATLAGTGNPAFQDGQGLSASFNAPNGGFVGPDQAAYVADSANHRIRKVDLRTGMVSTVAGTGIPGYLDGPAPSALLNMPLSTYVDGAGNVYIADTGNNRIRKISPGNPPIVSTVAGNGGKGYVDGPSAQFDFPNDLTMDSAGNLYVCEFNNHTIRKVAPDGIVSTFVGNGTPGVNDGIGTAARLNQPAGIAIDSKGNLYVTEWGSHRIRKVTPSGNVMVLAGGGIAGLRDGQGLQAQFDEPDGIAVSTAGTLFVTEHGNHMLRSVSGDGSVTTLAGTGVAGYADGLGAVAQFNGPGGIALDANGNLVIADTGNNRVRTATFVVQFARHLPSHYSPGATVTVVLDTSTSSFQSSTYAFAVQDTPPPGWTVGSVSAGGSYDPVTKTVKFGPFFDLSQSTLTYSVTPPSGETGTKAFQGAVSANQRECRSRPSAITASLTRRTRSSDGVLSLTSYRVS